MAPSAAFGRPLLRSEDDALLRGGGRFVAGIAPPAALGPAAHVAFVRAALAHARLVAVDLAAARAAPGVLDAADAEAARLAGLPPYPAPGGPAAWPPRPLLAYGRVRFVGEPIAVVVAETAAQALDAAEAVVVELEPLLPVVDPLAALVAEPLWPELGGAGLGDTAVEGNVVARIESQAFLDWRRCEVVVDADLMNQRLAPCPLEPRAALAYWEQARLVHWTGCQGASAARDLLAQVYGLSPGEVRVIVPDVGGSFGGKARLAPEEVLLGWLARRTGRPVRWCETRTESMTALGHGRAQRQRVRIGGGRDGRIRGYALGVVADAGAYPHLGAGLPAVTRLVASGPYDIAEAEFVSSAVTTSTTSVGAYRGAGRPEAAAALERAVDLFARAAGLDPVEVRRANLIPAAALPYANAFGAVYDSGEYRGALDAALDAAGYHALRAEQARRRAAGGHLALGIGVACYVESTALGGGPEPAEVELTADGGVLVRTGASPSGQGHATAWAQLAAARLGLPIERVTVAFGDTDLIAGGGLTVESRSLQTAGVAVDAAATELAEQARVAAAEVLGAAPCDVELGRDGQFRVVGAPDGARLAWRELAGSLGARRLVARGEAGGGAPTFPCGAHVAVVEVDLETGQVRLLRLVACDDAGPILNPLLADGQIHGGLAQGVGQALYEEFVYDRDGRPVNSSLVDYLLPGAAELPSFELIRQETPTARNPLGVKGIGESGAVGSTPAVQNAVVDALAHLGVGHVELPCSPERVWRALSAASSPGPPTPP
ncbi:MAG: xanthine dehydrogenase family protein molybdopterin-binding subunit [Acidimicrobiales bacterium]